MLFRLSNDSMRLFPQFTVVDMNPDQNSYSHLSIVKVTGEDALNFLQGQLTNDLQNLDGSWQYHGYCSPKGRTMAVFVAWHAADSFYLMSDSTVFETVIQRLKMYVLRSKVAFETFDTNLVGYDLLSSNSSHTFDLYSIEHYEDDFLLGFGDRALIVSAASSISSELLLPFGLDVKARLPYQKWIEADIKANLPRVTKATYEAFVPQMLNLDLVDGISFKKGCYTGQEIVARMRYLGKLKQRQYVAELHESNGANNIGAKIVTEEGKSVGQITNASAESLLVSAVLRTELIKGPLFLDSGEAISVFSSNQPYPVGNHT